MALCKYCRFWRKNTEDNPFEPGYCTKADGRLMGSLAKGLPDDGFYAASGENYGALVTGPNFGCKQYEPGKYAS